MRFIVGLGNPGLVYRVTRHNVGFMVIGRLARKHGIPISRRRFRARFGEGEIRGKRVVLIKPHTYMNLSGPPIKGFLGDYGCSLKDLIVIHDDLDLSFGTIRIRRGGGTGATGASRPLSRPWEGRISSASRLELAGPGKLLM